jgi:16S rRNA (uracil1498-N3)-methyltransferase
MKYHQFTRLFIPNLFSSKEVSLSSIQDIHYLANVMRKKVKDQLLIFNDKNGEYLAEILEINRKRILFGLIKQVRAPETKNDINLIFAPIKNTRINFLLEKATELGATKLTPIQTKHSVVYKINLAKWQIYIKEATEQCGRLAPPIIENLESLDKFLENWDSNNKIILCNETEHSLHMAQHLKGLEKNEHINIMIGPEGGFSYQELEKLMAKNFVTSVHLGKRILRAETAALSALSLVDASFYSSQ